MSTFTGTDVEAVMRRLEAAGSAQRRAIYRRHGAGEVQFGVSFADLRAIAKELGRDGDLARALWATGNMDARMLACMVADPGRTTEADLDRWLDQISYYALVDTFVRNLASHVPGVRARMERWTDSARDWTGQAGWDLLAHLAADDATLDDEFFLDRLERIEREIADAGNRTRYSMNGALINIGIRNEHLRRAAVAAAERIGPVVVDHGQTGCVTPAAVPYIERTLAHRADQAAKRAAKAARAKR